MATQMTEKPAAGGLVEAEVRSASEQFYKALEAASKGDIGPMEKVWSHADDVVMMPPYGGRFEGWQAVQEQFKHFPELKMTGRIVQENLSTTVHGDLGYAVFREVGRDLKINGKPVNLDSRGCDIFRREDGQWKMVVGHCDTSPSLIAAAGGGG